MAMIKDAEQKGLLTKDSVIIEPTSEIPNRIGTVGAARGYRVILTMPETMSVERRALLKAYGAELVLTDGSRMKGAMAEAERLAGEHPGSLFRVNSRIKLILRLIMKVTESRYGRILTEYRYICSRYRNRWNYFRSGNTLSSKNRQSILSLSELADSPFIERNCRTT